VSLAPSVRAGLSSSCFNIYICMCVCVCVCVCVALLPFFSLSSSCLCVCVCVCVCVCGSHISLCYRLIPSLHQQEAGALGQEGQHTQLHHGRHRQEGKQEVPPGLLFHHNKPDTAAQPVQPLVPSVG